MFFYSSLGRQGRSEDWTRHQRVLLDSLTISPGHAFELWYKKYHKDHPELFALQPDGTRGTWPPPLEGRHGGKCIKLCQSNPKVWDLWLREVEEQIEKNPYQTVFNASPNDGANDGVCICEPCRALDNPDGEICSFHWLGFGQEYVSMSDRQLVFARRLYKRLMERYPDKDYYIQLHGYGSTRFPPAGVNPPEKMLLSYVGNFPWGTEESRKASKENIHAWMSKGNHKLIYRPNCGGQPGLPRTHLKRTIEDFKWLANHNWMGIFIDTNHEDWATCGPQYYLMALMAWDPNRDGHVIMDDYYRRGFGPAAEEVKEYFNCVQSLVVEAWRPSQKFAS